MRIAHASRALFPRQNFFGRVEKKFQLKISIRAHSEGTFDFGPLIEKISALRGARVSADRKNIFAKRKNFRPALTRRENFRAANKKKKIKIKFQKIQLDFDIFFFRKKK